MIDQTIPPENGQYLPAVLLHQSSAANNDELMPQIPHLFDIFPSITAVTFPPDKAMFAAMRGCIARRDAVVAREQETLEGLIALEAVVYVCLLCRTRDSVQLCSRCPQKQPRSNTLIKRAAMKIAGTFAETKRLTTHPTIFMVGGAPMAHEVLP